MAPSTRKQNQVWVTLVFTLGSLALLILFSSAQRPIWYDEMVTFTFAALPDIHSALEQVWTTTTNLNQGTTGAYLMAEYISVRALGASWWAMRLPSLLATLWALVSLYAFLRAQRVPGILIAIAPILAIGFPTLWYFAGEARTYMPLVAAVLGVLAYYSVAPEKRGSKSLRILGWGSVLIGALFHPYFLLYWSAIVVLLYSVFTHKTQTRPTLIALARFSNPLLATFGMLTGLLIASATWLRGNIEQPVVWNEWLGSSLPKEILTSLFWPFVESGWIGIIASAILLMLIIGNIMGKSATTVWSPLALIALAVVLAVLVSLASILNEFWVFPRQWIASQAMVIAALPWLVSRLIAAHPRRSTILSLSLAGVLLLPVIVQVVLWKASDLRLWHAQALSSPYSQLSELELKRRLDSGSFPPDGEWNAFAQANLDQGGPIWPVLASYYTSKDWTTITLKRMSPQDLFLEYPPKSGAPTQRE